MPSTDANAHEMTLILKDQPSIKGVRFSVSKEFWRGYEFYDTLKDRMMPSGGECDSGWIRTAELTNFGILWEDGLRDTSVGMCDEGVLIPLRH